MFTCAQIMVCQRLQNVAVPNMISVAASGYTLELLFEGSELRDLFADNLELPDGNLVRVYARTFRMSTQLQ